MHHYQRGRTPITGLVLSLRESIETGRLVVVVMARFVLHFITSSKVVNQYCKNGNCINGKADKQKSGHSLAAHKTDDAEEEAKKER